MNIIELETPLNTEKYFAPKTEDIYPFYITEYGITLKGIPCYQLRMNSTVACIQYVISGTGIIINNDKIFTVREGDTFLLTENTDQIYYSNPDNNFERIWINFKGELAKKLIEIYKIQDSVVFKNVNTLDLLKEIHKICKENTDAKMYKEKTSQAFLKLVQFLSDNKTESFDVSQDIEKIRLYIDLKITENIKLSDLAKKFSFSKEHIIRLFKKNYGITPHRYILQSKMRIAMIMLKTTEMSVEEIAEKLNFSDSRHFSVQFRKNIGYKPSEYKNI